MATLFPISPVSLSGAATVAATRPPVAAPVLENVSSTVELSEAGLALAATPVPAPAAGPAETVAALALFSLLADPTTRAIANLFDPAYAAIIAASRLTDFVPPTHVFDPSALTGDVPGPVTPAAPAHGIADYKAAASGEAGQPAGPPGAPAGR